MSKILIALDESTVSTGFSVFKNNELIDYGVIQSKSKNVIERIDMIITEINKLIDKYAPNEIVAENVMITMSAPTAKALLGLELLIELNAFQKNIPCSLIRPSSWRKILGLSNSPKLKRADKKKETMEYIKNKYGIEEKIDDICDAIAIGTAYLMKGEII